MLAPSRLPVDIIASLKLRQGQYYDGPSLMQDGSDRALLELEAYLGLAQFWLKLGTQEEMEEEEAKSFLLLQQALIEKFERTLRANIGNVPAEEFRNFADKFKVRIVFTDEKATPYPRRHKK